jgi:hypothetical protein
MACQDLQWNTDRSGQTRFRRGGRSGEAGVGAPAEPQPNRPAEVNPEPMSVVVNAEPGEYYQLVLSRQPSAEAPPNFLYVPVSTGSAFDVANVLRRLYVPVGVHGHERCVMIYGAEAEWRAAADFSRLLDVAALETSPDRIPAGVMPRFRTAVALYMGASRPGGHDEYRLSEAAELFQQIASVEDATAAVRWAAGMLAGDVYSRIVYDFAKAEQLYLLAQGLAPPGGVEQMNAFYARARAHAISGKSDRARMLFARVVDQFTAFRHSEVYDRCRRALESPQR